MGAEAFDMILVGTSLNEAIRDAADEDLYMNGHDPYTGTIGQKSGAVLLKQKPGAKFPRSSTRMYDPKYSDPYPVTTTSTTKVITALWHAEEFAFRRSNLTNPEFTRWNGFDKKAIKRGEEAFDLLDRIFVNLSGAARATDKWSTDVLAFEVPKKDAAEVKAKRGRKGTHDKVWAVLGLAAS